MVTIGILVSGWSISKKSSHLKPLSQMNQIDKIPEGGLYFHLVNAVDR
jgi:hypothetical protein